MITQSDNRLPNIHFFKKLLLKYITPMDTLTKTNYQFPGQTEVYHGKVRDVYSINNEKLVMIATDRISAFDVVLPKGIPYKGQVLNQIASKFLDATSISCQTGLATRSYGNRWTGCEPYKVEMVIRGYIAGALERL